MAEIFQILISSVLLFGAEARSFPGSGFSPPPTTMIMPESNTTTIVTTIIASPNDDDLSNETNVTTEFDDSPEADAIRKCDEADRTGVIPDCTWVRKY